MYVVGSATGTDDGVSERVSKMIKERIAKPRKQRDEGKKCHKKGQRTKKKKTKPSFKTCQAANSS